MENLLLTIKKLLKIESKLILWNFVVLGFLTNELGYTFALVSKRTFPFLSQPYSSLLWVSILYISFVYSFRNKNDFSFKSVLCSSSVWFGFVIGLVISFSFGDDSKLSNLEKIFSDRFDFLPALCVFLIPIILLVIHYLSRISLPENRNNSTSSSAFISDATADLDFLGWSESPRLFSEQILNAREINAFGVQGDWGGGKVYIY